MTKTKKLTAENYAKDIVVALGLARLAGDSPEKVISEALKLYGEAKCKEQVLICASKVSNGWDKLDPKNIEPRLMVIKKLVELSHTPAL